MKNFNEDIRRIANKKGIKLWQIAEQYGCNDGNFSRKLRKELTTYEKQRILEIIEKISKEDK